MADSLRIMVVEDEFIIADEIASTIEDAGHEVMGPFASLEEAFRRLALEDTPDFAVLDANLRGKSSFPLAEKLKALGVPLCLCTGYRSDDLQSQFGDDVAVLQKPVNARALSAIIATAARSVQSD